MKDLMKMLGKPEQKGSDMMSDVEKKAKMEVIKELLEYAMDLSGENVSNGMQELTIAAPDKKGIMEGMETAEDMMEEMPKESAMPEMDEEDEEDEDEEEDY